MSTITVRKTKKAENLIVENQVAVAGTTLDAQLDVVEAASKVSVITGSTKPAAEVTASNAVIAGKAGNASVNQVAAGINSVVNSSNTITLSAVKVSGNVYGGALVLDAKGKIANRGDIGTAVVNGSTTVNLNNVISVKSVFGGGAGYGAVSNGDVTINYNGGKVSTIYGGGDRADVHGDVNINISATTGGKISKIYAGGKNSNVYGKATVTFSGNGGLYDNFFSGTVYGTGQKGSVTGGSELVFDNYSGKFKGSIQAFDTVTISGSSNVIFTKGQHKTMKGAQYVFVVEQGHTSPMLTWDQKVQYANITVKVETEDSVDAVLIQSKYFKKDADFSTDWITVTNEEGETLSSHAYELVYQSAYEWQVNAKGKGKWVKVRDYGTVSISYKGTNASFNGEEEERVVLSGADDKVNVSGNLKGGLSTGGGNDFIALQEGAKVSGGIDAGAGSDTLHVQKNVELNGVVSMGEGDDKVYVEEAAKVTSNIELGSGSNELTVQKDASVTGTVILEDGSSNVIRVNGGAISSVSGKANSNEIHLNGTIVGGGVGYWTELKAATTVTGGYKLTLPDGTEAFVPGEYVSNDNPNRIFVTGNLDLRNADSNDKVYVNQYAAVNSIYLGSGDDYLEIAKGAFVGHSYVSFGNAMDNGQAVTGTIDLGSGNNTLVLKGDVAANITSDVNAVNTVVLAGNITIDSNKFLTGRTGNVLIVSDGVEAEFKYTTVGAFIDGDKLFKGIYLSQNAMLNINGDKIIQNFVGAVSSSGKIYVTDAADDGFVNDYYTRRSNGVESSRLDAQEVVVRKGATISGSEINGAVTLENGATLTGGTVNGAILIMKGALVDGATLTGEVTLEKGGEIAGNTVIDTKDNVTLDGIVSDGTKINAKQVDINSLEALPSSIKAEIVNIVDEYVNEALVIDFSEELNLENAVIGNLLIDGKQYSKDYLGQGSIGENASLTITSLKWIIVNGSEESKEFADAYTVEIRGTVKGDAAFSNNTIYVRTANAVIGDITGSGKFVITEKVQTFFDYGQFTAGVNGFTFDIESGSLLTFDGVVSDEQKEQLINEKVNFLEDNAMFAIGKQAVIENWTDGFDFANDLPVFDKGLPFTDLYVKQNGKVFGAITGDENANVLELGAQVKVNGSRSAYDYATIDMGAGDDSLTMNDGVEVNGSIKMGRGNDTINMLGNVKVNTTVNQDSVAVDMGRGKDILNVEGSGNAIAGTLALTQGENTVNIKADSDLALRDLETAGADKTVFNIDGTLKIDAEALAFEAGETEIRIGENGAITDSEGNTVAAISMKSANANKLYNKGTLETDLEMVGSGSNLIDNFNSFTATDVLNMSGEIEEKENQGDELTDSVKYNAADSNKIENHGAFTAEAGIDMFGNANTIDSKSGKFTAGDVVMAGTKEVENDKLHEEERTVLTQADGSNVLINRDADNVMELGSLTMKGSKNAINVADDEEDGFAKGTISANGDVTMESYLGNVVKGTLNVTGDLRMSGEEKETEKAIYGSGSNEIDGTVTADSIKMFGAANTIKGQIEAGNGILMAGDQVDQDGEIVYGKAEKNTIDLNMAGSVSAEYASIEMYGDSNEIKSNAAQVTVDRAIADSKDSDEIEDINAKISSKGGIVMEGAENKLDFSVSAVAKGTYEAGKHDHAEIKVGNVDLSVKSDITMTGSVSNDLKLGYTLDADGEADIVAGNANISVEGDIVMEGKANTLDLAITLNSANQSKLEAGDLKLEYKGNISMTGKDAVNDLKLGVIANDLTEDDTHNPAYSERNVKSAEVSVTGDIVMGGENSSNSLTVGKDTTVSGSITMGDYDRDTATRENNLSLDVESAASITSIKLLADKNTVEFYGEGVVKDNFSVQGGENKIKVGEKVTVENDMVFTDLYDEDGDGVDNGDLLLENRRNDVTVLGKVAGIDSSKTSADDSFKVYGTAKDITTGNSRTGDEVIVGKGLLGEDDVKTDAAAGTVTMGSAETLSEGSNELSVNASSYTDADGNTTEYSAEVGEIRQYSKLENTVGINGGTEKTATTGAVTMVSDKKNTLEAYNNAVINGNVSMKSATGNEMTVQGQASEDGVVPADPEKKDYGSAAIQAQVNGSIAMTSSDGSNTASLIDAAVKEGIAMDARKKDAATADNTLTIAGSEYTSQIWNAETETHEPKTEQQQASVGGAVTMNAADSNTLDVKLATIGGAVTMTAGSSNSLDAALAEISGAVAMTADADNVAKFEDSTIGGTVDMTADADNELILTRTNSGKVTMKADGDNSMSVYGHFEKDPAEADVPSYERYTVDGIDMTGANNTLNVGDTDNLGLVELGAVNMTAGNSNTMNVIAGPEFEYQKDGESTDIDATAKADSITMSGAQNNELNVKQGTLKAGAIAMSNSDENGNAKTGSTNTVAIESSALLIAEAITMGSASVTPDVTTTAPGAYNDIDLRDIVKNDDGSETYVYVWKDGATTTTPGGNLFTETNTLDVFGKVTAADVSMTGRNNVLSIQGPAKEDPNGHNHATDYDQTIARGKFSDIKLSGETNVIGIFGDYKSAFESGSVTMGGIEIANSENSTIKVAAKENVILVVDNSLFNVAGDITMTAAGNNWVAIGDYSNELMENAVEGWVDEAGKPVYDKLKEDVVNVIDGSIIASSAENNITLGKNSNVNGALKLTGNSNTVTLNSEFKQTRFEVNADAAAVMTVEKTDGTTEKMTEDEFNAYRVELDAKTDKTEEEAAWLAKYPGFKQNSEEYTVDQGAVVNGDIEFKLLEKVYTAVPAVAPANVLNLGKGTEVGGNVVSTDTYTVEGVEGEFGAIDSITMEEGAKISGSVALGAGNDSITVNGDASIGGIDFGMSEGEFNWTDKAGYDYLNIESGMLTVNGDITYSGNLVVNGEVKFADGFGFVAANDDAKLYYENVTVENGTVEDPVELLGNLTFKGTVTVKAAISAYDTADVEYGATPAGDSNALTLADDAEVTLSDVNLGLGANTVTLGAGAKLTLDGAMTANAKQYKVVDGENVYVNADGQTDAELQAEYDSRKEQYDADLAAWETAYNEWLALSGNEDKTEEEYIADSGNAKPAEPVRKEFVQGYADGTIDVTVKDDSVLTVNGEANVNSLILATDTEEVAKLNYTINGEGTLVAAGNIKVAEADVNIMADVTIGVETKAKGLYLTGHADTVTLNAAFKAETLATGADNDVLNINAAFTATTLDMGDGEDVLNINAAGSSIDTIRNAEMINISADTTLNVIEGAAKVVVNKGTLTLKSVTDVSEVVVNDGSVTTDATEALNKVTVNGGSVNGAKITVLEAKADFTLSGANVIGAINVAQAITATGAIEQASALTISGTGSLTLGSVKLDGADLTADAALTTGNISAQNITATAVTAADITATGTITASSINAQNISATEVTATTIIATGDISAQNISATEVTAVNVTASEISGKFTVRGTLSGTTFTGVAEESSAATIKFIGTVAGFNSEKLTADSYVFGTADGVDEISDAAAFADLDALNVSLAKLDMTSVSENDSFAAANFAGTIDTAADTLKFGGFDWTYDGSNWASSDVAGVTAGYDELNKKFTFTVA